MYFYTVVKASETNDWQLQKAWLNRYERAGSERIYSSINRPANPAPVGLVKTISIVAMAKRSGGDDLNLNPRKRN